MFCVFYVIFEYFEAGQSFITHKTVSRQLNFIFFARFLMMTTTPIFGIQSMELSLLSTAIWIDNHQIREWKDLQSGFLINEYSKVMSIGTSESFELKFHVIAQK